jgi:hypothetical protein
MQFDTLTEFLVDYVQNSSLDIQNSLLSMEVGN